VLVVQIRRPRRPGRDRLRRRKWRRPRDRRHSRLLDNHRAVVVTLGSSPVRRSLVGRVGARGPVAEIQAIARDLDGVFAGQAQDIVEADATVAREHGPDARPVFETVFDPSRRAPPEFGQPSGCGERGALRRLRGRSWCGDADGPIDPAACGRDTIAVGRSPVRPPELRAEQCGEAVAVLATGRAPLEVRPHAGDRDVGSAA
jgi:hypothetical protein